jgi:nicotinamidase/pyrazinamidase
MKKNALLIIDAQYDFCHPAGALYVPGADADMQRLATLITHRAAQIDHIVVTLDNHPVNDISHPGFWQGEDGHFPPPFTQITAAEVKAGKWKARFQPEKALVYLEELEKQGKFLHFIWPEHCLIGSRGAALDDTLLQALRLWTRTGKQYHAIEKGQNPMTEHFGIFQAQIPIPEAPETHFNQPLVDELLAFERVFLMGEAKSHCVATSLQQILDHAPMLAAKLTIVENLMSDVSGLGHLGEPTFAQARQQGIRFKRSDEDLFGDI